MQVKKILRDFDLYNGLDSSTYSIYTNNAATYDVFTSFTQGLFVDHTCMHIISSSSIVSAWKDCVNDTLSSIWEATPDTRIELFKFP